MKFEENKYLYLKWLEQMQLAEKEPMMMFAVLLAALAILLALLAILKTRRLFTPKGGNRFSSEIQEHSLRLNDFTGRFGRDLTKLTEEIRQLQERLARMEREFAILTRRSYEEFQKEQEAKPKGPPEKKNDLISVPLEPVAVIPTDLLPPHDPSPSFVPAQAKSIALAKGLQKTRASLFGRLRGLVSRKPESSELYAELEELLISSDLGVHTAEALIAELRGYGSQLSEADIREALKNRVVSILSDARNGELSGTKVDGAPRVVLVVGVNGVGKTTTIGKLSARLKERGLNVIVGACDTFRAAAVEQIEIWAAKNGVELVKGEENAKPTTVAYQSVHRAIEAGADVLILDTAGRLHTRVNLMNELGAVVNIINRELPGAPHETLLVLDASTGQNALQQAREFHSIANLTGLVITKLDGTPKGGIVVAIREELDIPIRYIGVGEGVDDLRPFSATDFADALFADDDSVSSLEEQPSARAAVRRRRRDDSAARDELVK